MMTKKAMFLLIKIASQTLIKIGFISVTRNRPGNVTQNWFHKCYSKLVQQLLLEIDPQTLLKIGFTSVTQT